MWKPAAVALLAMAALAGSASAQSCRLDDTRNAENAAVAAKDWGGLHAAFAAWPGCDDGAVAEMYSDRVAMLLASHWSQVDRFRRFAAKDPGFRVFVLNHIDGLMTPDQAHAIERNARDACPAGTRVLCREIARRAHAATQA